MIERNDVDISKLFTWGKLFALTDSEGNPISQVYMRLVGDADINKSRVYALRRSAELRKKLKDSDSDERLAYIHDQDVFTKDSLITVISTLFIRELAQKSVREVKLPFPKEPKSDAELESFEKYQKEVDAYPDKQTKARQKYVETGLKALANNLKDKDVAELYDIYETKAINSLCEAEMLRAFREKSTYFGTYSDEDFKQHFFKDFADFENMEPGLKEQFIAAYESLEVGSEELKKLLQATQ